MLVYIVGIDVTQPVNLATAKKLVGEILATGELVFWKHAEEELANDGMTTVDAESVLRGGVYQEPEWRSGAWRYKAVARGMTIVFELDSETCCIVVTAWRTSG